jgi:hypothetical protein
LQEGGVTAGTSPHGSGYPLLVGPAQQQGNQLGIFQLTGGAEQ